MMNWLRLRTVARNKLLALFMPLMLLAAIACTPSELELLEGILQNVDSVNGEITIVTKDGKTVTLTIATEAPIDTEGATSALETLELGASVEVEVDEDGQVAQRIEARQAKIKGVIVPGGIVQVDGNVEVTIETERGRRRTLTITDDTRIDLGEGFPGIPADLVEGQEVEVKFDPDSLVAFKIDTEEEEAKIEGVIVPDGIVQIDDVTTEVTIETERGRRLTLVVGGRTRIELEGDFPGTVDDLAEGQDVEAKFDPFTRTAYKIEVEEEGAEEIEGVIVPDGIVQVDAVTIEVTIETESGLRRTLTIDDQTRIELEDDDFPGTTDDLAEGQEVEAKFDPVTGRAFKVEVKEAEEEEGRAKIEGVIVPDGVVQIDAVTIEVTIETESGFRRTLVVDEQTQIELEDDFPGTVEDLAEGQDVEAKFDSLVKSLCRSN